MNGIRLTLLVLSVCALVPACATPSKDDTIAGRVVEESTNKPVPGAIVTARWKKGISVWFAESQTVCYHVESTTTDAQGNFRLPRFEGDPPSLIDAFKPGYRMSPGTYSQQTYLKNIYLLQPFSGTREQRLKYLDGQEYATRCPGAKDSAKNMLPFYRAIHDEAQSLVKTKADQKIADGFLSDIETIELGYDAALKRSIERAQGRESEK